MGHHGWGDPYRDGYHDIPRSRGASSPWWATRPPTASGSLRVSNAEREEVVQTLIKHWSDGRLDEATFDQRAIRARSATTRADLDGLLADLPPLHPAPVAAPPPPHRSQWRIVAWVMVAVLLLSTIGSWALGTAGDVFHPHVPWLLVALVVWVALRGRRRIRRW